MYTQFPYQQLTKIGTDLETLNGELKQDHHGAQDVEGLDPEDHANIISAIEGFGDEWYTSLLQLQTEIGKTGTLAKQIGKVAGHTDHGLASEFGKS